MDHRPTMKSSIIKTLEGNRGNYLWYANMQTFHILLIKSSKIKIPISWTLSRLIMFVVPNVPLRECIWEKWSITCYQSKILTDTLQQEDIWPVST